MAALFTSLRALRSTPSVLRTSALPSRSLWTASPRQSFQSASPVLRAVQRRNVVTVGRPTTTTTTAASYSFPRVSSTARSAGLLASIAAVGLGLSLTSAEKPVSNDSHVSTQPPTSRPREPLPPPPASTVNVYELSFGTVCGICAGVFLKKGAKALAFVFGGVFVLLQYFSSTSLIRVDWSRAASRFEKLFYSAPAEPGGKPRPPTISSVYNWFVNFLTADFQQRASFLAGFALGLRIG